MTFLGPLDLAVREVLPLEQAVLAHQKVEAGEVFGRIVLVPSSWADSLSGKLLSGAGMTERRAGSRGSRTLFFFRMIMAALAFGLGMLGGV